MKDSVTPNEKSSLWKLTIAFRKHWDIFSKMSNGDFLF